MIRHALPIAAIATLAAPAAAAEVQIIAQGPVVELNVSETIKAKPDIATVSAGVTTQAPTAVEAMRLNAERMEAVIRRIKALGVAADDIQTTGISLGAQYDYDQGRQTPVFRAYQASNRVSVTLRNVSETGRVLDALVAAGATDINGPDFSLDDDTAQRAVARRAALDKAQAQAAEYARWAGFSGVRLLEIGETLAQGRPMPYAQMRTMDVAEAAKAPTPIEPGLVGTVVNLTVKYEMTR